MGLYRTWQRARSESMGIPPHVIDRAEKAGFRSPDFYVGATVENTRSTVAIFISKLLHHDTGHVVRSVTEERPPQTAIEELRASDKSVDMDSAK